MPPWSGGKTYLTTGLEFYHLRIETLKGFRNIRLHIIPESYNGKQEMYDGISLERLQV